MELFLSHFFEFMPPVSCKKRSFISPNKRKSAQKIATTPTTTGDRFNKKLKFNKNVCCC